MRGTLRPAVVRLAIFLLVCLLSAFALYAVFAQLRYRPESTYTAEFTDVSGLKTGQFVRIAGVEVGQVQNITLNDDATVAVDFNVDDSVVLTQGSRVAIRYNDLVGGRYLSLEEGVGDPKRLTPRSVIPISRTAPALDLDALIGGFRPLFRALSPDQVNALSGQLISAFQGEGGTINSFFANTAALTSTLADQDELIGGVITNLQTVLGSLGDQSTQFAMAVNSLSQLLHTLANRKQDVANAVAYTNAAAGSLADLLAVARPPAKKVVNELDRTAGIVVADHDYVDNLLNTLPDAYQILNRQGLYGDFFSFYLCDVVLKLNGKGGQPVYVKVVGQVSGRCTPR
jgi:phospholipid/cholesterol/gamma-HCH transport system substrate-binding protein